MKYYQSYCRKCSNPKYPELRWFIEKDDTIMCTSCGHILIIEEVPDSPGYYVLNEPEEVDKNE